VLRCAENPELELIFSNTTEIGIVLDEADAATPPGGGASLLSGEARRVPAASAHAGRRFDTARAPVVIPTELIEDNGDKLREIVATLAQRWSVEPRVPRMARAVPVLQHAGRSHRARRAERGVRGRAASTCSRTTTGMITIAEPYRLFAIEGDAALRARLASPARRRHHRSRSITPYRLRKVSC
jgi:tagaturonate reductase